MAQRNTTHKKRPVWVDAFLQHVSLRGNVTEACEVCGIERSTPYQLRENNEWFGQLWEEADRKATDRLIAEGWRRAQEGVTEPVFYQGQECGTVQKYSDTLLIFLSKARDPEKYRDRYDVKSSVTIEGGDYMKELIRLARGTDNAEPASHT
ncbi:MAG: terminase [Gammaproteobacteria bacterium]|nr:terminase [Gammaproteobacteria bacterium]